MPTIPSTGTTWDGAGFNNVDSRFLERGKLQAVAIRDARGTATDMSPHNPDGSARYSPFALDGNPRSDLFAFVRGASGVWSPNPNPNEGFHLIGAFHENDGPDSKPKITNDNYMINQSNFPFDSDIINESEPFSFTGVETAKPLLRRLRNNLPLSDPNGNLLLEDVGQLNAGWAKPLDADNVDRQVIKFFSRKSGGKSFYTAVGYNLAHLTNIGQAKMDKKAANAANLEFEPLPDGLFMAMVDGVYRAIIDYLWLGGAAWPAWQGAPVLSSTPPVAAPTGTGHATLAFAVPTGGSSTFTYVGNASTDGGTTWGSNLTPTSVVVASGTVTLTFAGLATGSTKLRAVVTGSSGLSTTGPASNAVTIT